MVATDDVSRHGGVYLLRRKSEAAHHIKELIN